MELKSTRKIISILLVIIIALSTVFYCGFLVMSSTIGSQKFIQKHFVTNQLVAECEKQLDMKYDVLEQKSGIPARVFQNVKTAYNTRSTMTQAVEYLFDVNDSTLYNDTKIEYFEGVCKEYLEGNNIKYKKENVRVVAEEAARIYSDSVGIHNADSIKQFVATVSRNCSRIQSICALVSISSAILIIIMFKQQIKGYLYVTSSLIAGGLGTVLGSLAGLVARIGANNGVTPYVYQQSIYAMSRLCITCIALFGLLVMILGIAGFAFCMYRMKVEKNRKDTRFSKMVVKL